MVDRYTDSLRRINDCKDDLLSDANPIWGRHLISAVSPKITDGADNYYQYEWLKYIYKGGESVVMLVRDRRNRREVVFKVALPQRTPDQAVKKGVYKQIFLRVHDYIRTKEDEKRETEYSARFTRGCFLQLQLHNILVDEGYTKYGYIPNILDIQQAPFLYAIMEYIDAPSLMRWCESKSDEEILAGFHKILRVVEMIHRSQVVHSDLKPGNILMNNDMPVFLDFTIAKNLGESKSVTSANTRLGSPLFSDPSQLEYSKFRTYLHDIATLGYTFWCVWNRGEPDDSGLIKVDNEVLKKVFPSELFPFALRKIFERAVHHDESQRYQDVTEFRADVEACLAEYRSMPDATDLDAIREELKSLRESVERLQTLPGQVVALEKFPERLKRLEKLVVIMKRKQDSAGKIFME